MKRHGKEDKRMTLFLAALAVLPMLVIIDAISSKQEG